MRGWTPEEIKRLRQAMGLTQKEFGVLLGVTRNFIYYLERGERKPSKTFKLLLECIEEKHLTGKESEKGHGKRNLQKG
jgi:DNA-binding transcriptional regulator YiaG